MDTQVIHKAICSMPIADKMQLSLSCQIHGVRPEDLEITLANIITGIEVLLKPTFDNLTYWCQR